MALVVLFCFFLSHGSAQETKERGDGFYQIARDAQHNDYDKAIKNYLLARYYYSKAGYSKGLSYTYNSLGLTYQDIEEYTLANEYFHMALTELKNDPDKEILSFVYNNMGMLASDRNQLDSAIYFYNRSLELKKELKDTFRMASTLTNLGIVMLKKQEFGKALHYNKLSYEIKKSVRDTVGIITAYSNFANIYGYLGRFDSVKYFLDAQIPLLETHGSRKDKLMFFGNYSEYYKAVGNFRAAADYKDSVLRIQKELFNEQVSANLAEYEVRYKSQQQKFELQEQRYQNEILEKKEKKERQQKYFLLILMVLLVVILLLLLRIFRNRFLRNRKEKELLHRELELKEKELLSSSALILQKREVMFSLNKRLTELKKEANPSPEALIAALKESIRQDTSVDKEWEKFKVHFEQTYNSFFADLLSKYPELTESDLRHCAYIKIGLTTKEIGSLLNIAPSSVQKSRVRLKKKLNLDSETDLRAWIQSL